MISRFLNIIFFFCLQSVILQAQQEQISLLNAFPLTDSLLKQQEWRYGTDKIANTFLFSSDMLIRNIAITGTEYLFKKRYRGSIMRTNTIAVQDNITVQGLLKHKLSDAIQALGQILYSSRSDSRDIALQSAKRMGGYIGLGYQGNLFSGEVYGGFEANEQLGIKGGGASAYGHIRHVPINLSEGLMLQSEGRGQFTAIDSMRNMADIDVMLSAFSYQQNGSRNRIYMQIRSTMLNRDFYSPQGSNSGALAIERRLEQRNRADADIGIEILPKFSANFMLNAEIADIARLFRNPITEFSNTAINRNLQEFIVNVTGSLSYDNESGNRITGGFSLFNRDEKNAVKQVFAIDQDQLDIIRKQEFQRDNVSNRFRLFSFGQIILGKHDTIGYDASASLLRYDTPSTSNNDDRDEQTIIASLFWKRPIDEHLTISLLGGLQQTHFVFLKSERSSLSNRNSSIRFAPGLQWRSRTLEFNPQFEVLANYTIYDFELPGTAVRSFSFRQFSYRDSIRYVFRKDWTIEGNLFIRRFDRGIMSWSEFSETPITMSTEQFFKFLMFVPATRIMRIGLGGRFYQLIQEPYSRSIGQNTSQLNAKTLIYGPEMFAQAQFPDGSSISLRSWYEWQFFGESSRRNQINLFLQASLFL
jgi:hypothetical protein